VAQRLMSVRSEQELMELLVEHPELMPVLEQMVSQTESGERAHTGGPEVGQYGTSGAPVEVPPRFQRHIIAYAPSATAQLMTDFYHRLYDDRGHKVGAAAVALQESMLEMREQREHPCYWAPFVLVGDWR